MNNRVWIGISASLVCGSIALGDGPVVIHGVEFAEPPTAMSIETDDGWRFEPASSGGETIGFLASYSGGGGTPASIRLAWFEPAGNGTWSAWGWQDASELEAAAYLIGFFQDQEMFAHSGTLSEVDFSAVTPAGAPMVLRFGFDVADPFQPVLEEVGPAGAEVLVEIGAVGMPVLAPMSLPAAGGPNLQLECASLDAALGELEQEIDNAFDEISELDPEGNGGGCDMTCKRTTTKYKFPDVCTGWSPYVITVGGVCERSQSCKSKTWIVEIYSDCSTSDRYEYGPSRVVTQTTPALTRPDGSKYCP